MTFCNSEVLPPYALSNPHFCSLFIQMYAVPKNMPHKSVFTAYIMLFISDNCRLHVGQVVIRDKLIIR